ncbi:MAG: hypothetical protein HY554_18410 [Elusimicrobia bacterium]|nr:hypothetical protein [Elusimicrobiota bacterium]
MTAPKAKKRWWVYVDQRVHGPFPLEDVLRIPGVGERTRICPEGSQEWTTLGDLADSIPERRPAETSARCPNCSRRSRLGARYCDHCGTLVTEEPGGAAGSSGPGAHRRSPWLQAAAVAAVLAGVAFSLSVLSKRREAAEPTGRVTIEVGQVLHVRSLRDIRGEERTPLPGKRFCLLTLVVRNQDLQPARFSRGELRWVGPGGRAVDLDGLTPFLPNELVAAPQLEPGARLEGRVLFQAPDQEDRFTLAYKGALIEVPRALLEADRRWRDQESAAIRRLEAFRCVSPDGPRPWDAGVEMKARRESGSVYHVDAEDYSFHVDLAGGRVSPAADVEGLVAENTRKDCFSRPAAP